MIPILRSILAVVVGLMAGFLIVVVGDMMSSLFVTGAFAGDESKDAAAMRAYVESLPFAAFIVMLIGHTVGALVAGLLAAWIAGRARFMHSGLVGILFLVAGALNLWLIPFHPLWFVVADVIVYVPAALIGAWWAPARPRQLPTS